MIRASVMLGNDSRTVERPGPGKAPTAFRIWAAGDNPTDKGLHRFTATSADALMGAQRARGNTYSIDVDHLSLSESAPPEARKAVGWMRLATRLDDAGNHELWAVGVEWTAAVKAGLECDPPEWRYFSPAYDVDKKTGEINRFLNTALTNNPATWGVTALATAKENPMTIEELLAELQKLADAGDERAKKALAALAPEAPASTPDVAAADEPKPAEEPKKAAETPPGDEKKPDATASVLASILSTVQGLAAKVSGLEADKEKAERSALLASRPDFAPEVVTVLAKAPMSLLRDAVKTLPRAARNPAAAAQPDVKASVGATQGQGDTAPRLPPEESKAIRAAMGLVRHNPEIKLDRGTLVMASMTPDQANELLAKKRESATQNAATTAGKVA